MMIRSDKLPIDSRRYVTIVLYRHTKTQPQRRLWYECLGLYLRLPWTIFVTEQKAVLRSVWVDVLKAQRE